MSAERNKAAECGELPNAKIKNVIRGKKTLYRGEYKNEIDIGFYFSVLQWENYMCNTDDLRTKKSRPRLQGHERDILCRYKRSLL
jgi:hypothetical protein